MFFAVLFHYCSSCSVSSPLRSIITYLHGTFFLSFFNYKNFFRPIWSIEFRKNVFAFWYSNMINNLKFRIFIINFFARVNMCTTFNIRRLDFNCSTTCIVAFIYCVINLSNLHFLILKSNAYKFCFFLKF